MPDLAILMTVYNGMPYLKEAIDSIRRQTLQDWTAVIVDDGSTDATADYLDRLADPRFCVAHQANGGTAAAANHGLLLCETEFLARMDADDVSLPTRFQEQLDFLRSHPEVGLVGAQVAPLGQRRVGRSLSLPIDHDTIDARLIAGHHAICHSSIMCRTSLLRELGGYRQQCLVDDWDMFLRMGERARLANVDQLLLHYRVLPGSLQSRRMAEIHAHIAHACHCARRRRAGVPEMAYDEFLAQRNQAPWRERFQQSLRVHALTHYRRAQAEILGPRPVRGYARLVLAAACSPQLTGQRIVRMLHRQPLLESPGFSLQDPISRR